MNYRLTGDPLENKVESLFNNAGFTARRGRIGKEDLVVSYAGCSVHKAPLVVEVKSGKGNVASRRYFRQLDDWVYDLSDESTIRKNGLVLEARNLSSLEIELEDTLHIPVVNPNLHKGVFVYNGPIGKPFGERPDKCYSPNDKGFLEDRCICLIALSTLILLVDKVKAAEMSSPELWSLIHRTYGQIGA